MTTLKHFDFRQLSDIRTLSLVELKEVEDELLAITSVVLKLHTCASVQSDILVNHDDPTYVSKHQHLIAVTSEYLPEWAKYKKS